MRAASARGRRSPTWPGLPLLAIALLVTAGCEERPPEQDPLDEAPAAERERARAEGIHPAQDEFWAQIQALCDQAYAGRVTRGTPQVDDDFMEERLVMHVRECAEDEIKIPFHVGENRSRTWVLTRTEAGLRLKHDHRHEDGTQEEVTWYGGDTEDEGTGARQAFHADQHTADLLPEARTNIWTMEIEPGERFVYDLVRVGTERRFRADFDLSEEVEAPPAPWGHE